MNWFDIKSKSAAMWGQLGQRDRRAIVSGIIILFVFLLYMFAWQPLYNQRLQVMDQVNTIKNNVPVMISSVGEYQQLRMHQLLPSQIKPQPITKAVNTMLAKQQLVPFGIKTKMLAPNKMQLTFKQCPFDMMMIGFESLIKDGVFVQSANIKRSAREGLVDGKIELVQLNLLSATK